MLAGAFILAQGNIKSETCIEHFRIKAPAIVANYTLHLSDGQVDIRIPVDVSGALTPPEAFIINEIFPRATDAQPEWLELFNISDMPLNLKNWRYGDFENPVTIAALDIVIPPHGFCILTRNAAQLRAGRIFAAPVIAPLHWQTLDNYRQTIGLWAPGQDRATDSVAYDHQWFDQWPDGFSLERVSSASGASPRSWAPAKPSPGRPNASALRPRPEQPRLHIGPTPFTPNGDGRDDYLFVISAMPAGAKANVTIYGFSGEKLKTFPSPIDAELRWPGKRDNGMPAPVGPFFVVLEVDRDGDRSHLRCKGILWR